MRFLHLFKKKYQELIILHDYTVSGGSGRPIYNYYKHQLTSSNKRVVLLRMVTSHSSLKLFYLSFFSDRIIVNGIACFRYWSVLLVCYLKKDLVIYLHEAAPHVEPFAKKYPLKFRFFIKLLNKRRIAFVSEWQRQYFLKFSTIPKYKLIYNNINFPYTKEKEEQITIGMIGYQTENKNVSFFSKVADRSVGKGLPYQFVWIGGYAGETKKLYRSKNVLWVGDQDQVMDTLNSIDILLFTSCNDTFGLALAEALVKGKRIVSYVENGLAPFLEKLKGCRIYRCFDEEVVLACIEEVCQEKVDVHRHQELAMELCSMQNFEQRLNDLFEY